MALAELTPEQQSSVLDQAIPKMTELGIDDAVVMYDRDSNTMMSLSPAKAYNPKSGRNRPQLYSEKLYAPSSPFYLMPRLSELRNWYIFPDKSTNFLLYSLDGTVQNLVRQFIAIVVGDGPKVTVYDKDLKFEDQETTRYLREWSKRAGGKGRSIASYVIPNWIIDNIVVGNTTSIKYIGRWDDELVEPGDLALLRIDPRLYAVVPHDDRLWEHIVMFPIRQPGQPQSKLQFDNWNPSYRGMDAPYSSTGLVQYDNPIILKYNTYYNLSLFQGYAPLSTIIGEIVSTIELRFYRNQSFRKFAFPVILLKVSRHSELDKDNAKYMNKLGRASQYASEIRAGDSIAIQGRHHDGEGNELDPGWEVQVLDVKNATMDFGAAFQQIDTQKAYGLGMSMGMLETVGQSGAKNTLTSGSNIGANVSMGAKTVRMPILEMLVDIFRDVALLRLGKELDRNQIDVQFSEIRENDVAAYSSMILQALQSGATNFEETRKHLGRVGMNLEQKTEDEVLAEFMARQQAAAGFPEGEGGEGELEGGEMDEELPDEDFPDELAGEAVNDPFWGALSSALRGEED